MPDKACRRCKQWKPLPAFNKDKTKKDGHHGFCKECTSQGNQEWRRANLEALKEKKRAYYYQNRERILKQRNIARNGARYLARLKQEVYNHYGNKCYCCGLSDPRFLTIEHLSNDGKAQRHPGGKAISGTAMYRRIIDASFPDDIALACFNCNCARAYFSRGGICPHQIPLPRRYNKERFIVEIVEQWIVEGRYDLPKYAPEDVKNDPRERAVRQKLERNRKAPTISTYRPAMQDALFTDE